VEDLVSEAFVKVLQVLQRGGGPDVAFRAYLLTAVRRLRVDRQTVVEKHASKNLTRRRRVAVHEVGRRVTAVGEVVVYDRDRCRVA